MNNREIEMKDVNEAAKGMEMRKVYESAVQSWHASTTKELLEDGVQIYPKEIYTDGFTAGHDTASPPLSTSLPAEVGEAVERLETYLRSYEEDSNTNFRVFDRSALRTILRAVTSKPTVTREEMVEKARNFYAACNFSNGALAIPQLMADFALEHTAPASQWRKVETAEVGEEYWVTYQEHSNSRPLVRIGMVDSDGFWYFPQTPGLKVGRNYVKAIIPYTRPEPYSHYSPQETKQAVGDGE